MSNERIWKVLVIGLLTGGCGRTVAAQAPHFAGLPELPPGPAKVRLEEGLRAMAAHDKARDWTEPGCKATAALLLSADAPKSPIPSYDAALVMQRCRLDDEAKTLLRAALDKDPSFYPARAALALYEADRGKELDQAIADLRGAVLASRFSSVEAQIALAILQMKRGGTMADDDGTDDLDRAQKNLHRALAIDDGSVAALNQLALLHRRRFELSGGSSRGDKKEATQRLDLAILVCTQAIRKNPNYAPAHNTMGLLEMDAGNLSRAAQAFDEARRVDPKFTEAQMNYAAVNLQVRGFENAEKAYRAVLALTPDDYDARVGLALAVRGQIDDASVDRRVKEAREELAAAKRIAPARPEAYYNDAILASEYGARGGDPHVTKTELLRAKALLTEFLARAEGSDRYAETRERARERLKEIDEVMRFVP